MCDLGILLNVTDRAMIEHKWTIGEFQRAVVSCTALLAEGAYES